jgi:demethylmacrocin O-methyltransferase
MTEQEKANEATDDLAELFRKYGSDKDKNGYSSVYHILFHGWRNKPLKMLEIGIGTMIEGAPSSMLHYGLPGYAPGASLKAWRDYFSQGEIMGVDIQPDTQFEGEPRIRTALCDSQDSAAVDALLEGCHESFDIILDDGLHSGESQFCTLQNMFPYVKEGGFYVIEDVCVGSSVSRFPELVRKIVGDCPFFYSGLQNNLCIIHKSRLNYTRIS